MNIEILRKQPVKFYKKNGIKFFEPFVAADKDQKPIELSWETKSGASGIRAKSTYNDDISIFNIDVEANGFKGSSLIANPRKKEIGEILNLASLITFKENSFPSFDIFAFRSSIQFYAKYGFNIFSENINEIINNLKFLTELKGTKFINTRISASHFMKQLSNTTDKNYKLRYAELSNNLVSEHLRTLAREGEVVDKYNLCSHTHMRFTTPDMLKNKDYLNELLDKHKINYEI